MAKHYLTRIDCDHIIWQAVVDSQGRLLGFVDSTSIIGCKNKAGQYGKCYGVPFVQLRERAAKERRHKLRVEVH